MTKLKNLNCYKTQKIKLWQNSKTQIVKVVVVTVLVIVTYFSKNNWTPQQPMICSQGSFRNVSLCFAVRRVLPTIQSMELQKFIRKHHIIFQNSLGTFCQKIYGPNFSDVTLFFSSNYTILKCLEELCWPAYLPLQPIYRY